MRISRSWMVVVLVAAVVWAVSSGLNQAQPLAAAGGTRVAVVDLFRVFNAFEQTEVLNQKMAEFRQQIQEEGKKKIELIQIEQKTLEQFTPDSAEWYRKNRQIKEMQLELRIWESLKKEDIEENYLRWVRRTYETVNAEIQAAAKRHGFDIVITRDEMEEEPDARLGTTERRQLLLQQILNRKVVYAADGVDISHEVLANLNSAFAKAGGSASIKFDR